jgi:hypothetical protein
VLSLDEWLALDEDSPGEWLQGRLEEEEVPDAVHELAVSWLIGVLRAISDEAAREGMRSFRRVAIPASAVARGIAYALEQPPEVDVSEIIVRPTASPH